MSDLSEPDLAALRERIAAERRSEPWPQFGASPDSRQAARDGFNMALDVVDDILAAANPEPEGTE